MHTMMRLQMGLCQKCKSTNITFKISHLRMSFGMIVNVHFGFKRLVTHITFVRLVFIVRFEMRLKRKHWYRFATALTNNRSVTLFTLNFHFFPVYLPLLYRSVVRVLQLRVMTQQMPSQVRLYFVRLWAKVAFVIAFDRVYRFNVTLQFNVLCKTFIAQWAVKVFRLFMKAAYVPLEIDHERKLPQTKITFVWFLMFAKMKRKLSSAKPFFTVLTLVPIACHSMFISHMVFDSRFAFVRFSCAHITFKSRSSRIWRWSQFFGRWFTCCSIIIFIRFQFE